VRVFSEVLGILVILAGAVTWYHNQDLKGRVDVPITEIRTEATINRLMRLCGLENPDSDLVGLKERLKARYLELSGREFSGCE